MRTYDKEWKHIDSLIEQNGLTESALTEVTGWVKAQGWTVLGSMESPISGGDGNREYLLAARKG